MEPGGAGNQDFHAISHNLQLRDRRDKLSAPAPDVFQLISYLILDVPGQNYYVVRLLAYKDGLVNDRKICSGKDLPCLDGAASATKLIRSFFIPQ